MLPHLGPSPGLDRLTLGPIGQGLEPGPLFKEGDLGLWQVQAELA